MLNLPAYAATQQHKTGWVGMNLAPTDYYSNEMPFANLAKLASRWRLQDQGPFSWDLPLPPLTEDGCPTSVPPDSYVETFLLSTNARKFLPAELFVSYDGEGVLEYAEGARLVKRFPGVDQIRCLQTSDVPMMARLVSTNPENPLRNVSFHEGHAAPPKETFRKAFLERNASMAALRFMDWMKTNESKIEHFEQRPMKNAYTQSEKGVALEYMIELANELKSAPWFTMPHLATDDYVRQFAEMVRRDLDPSLPVYVEYSNEVWNTTFEQARWAQAQGLSVGLSTDPFEAQLRFYSQRATEMLGIWDQVFGADKARVLGVYASQAGNPESGETILGWKDAGKYADVHAIAPYFGNGFGDPAKLEEVSRWSLDRLFSELEKEIDGSNKSLMVAQAALARKFGVSMVAYEGGQHLVGYGGAQNDDLLTMLFVKANWDPRMGELYRKYMANWRAVGGGTFMFYSSMGSYSKWGSWGLLENEDKPTSAKWEAVRSAVKA
ncbi:hypothetical protein QTL95_01840 [Rhizobium sp. S152]|uniref:hypothetical protein n=1 Tax=Rhizobium sp. S152 TaxID=3055038 RepID=UPI0025A9AB26|nr:hypothetical protein [Rhizobium sp. S152]MDM9624618.1 hypothetical protein [Rhizobium sp. S152]